MNTQRIFFTMAILWIGHFMVDFMLGVWPVYKTMAQLDIAMAGFLVAICSFFGEGMQIIFGSLSDRGYRKQLILLGVLLTAAGGLYAFTQSFPILFLFLLSISLGSGAFHPSAVSLLGSLPSQRKGLLIGIFATGGSLGMAGSQFVFSHTHLYFSGNTLILIVPAVVLTLLASFYKFSGVERSTGSYETKKHVDLKQYVKCLKNRNIACLFSSQICNQTLMWGTNFLLPDVLNSRGYDSWVTYGAGHFCFIIGGVFTLIPAGYLSDRFSARTVLLIASGLGSFFLYIFLLNPELPQYAALLLLFLIGASLWTVNPVSVSFGNKLMPQNPGVVSALLMGLVWCVSECVGPGGGGILTRLFDDDAAGNVLCCLGLLLFVGMAFIYKLPGRVVHPEPEKLVAQKSLIDF